MIEAVIFDMDGTLLDTLTDLANCCNYALRVNGYKEHSIDEVKFFVGNGFAKLIERALPQGRANRDYQKVFNDASSYYAQHYRDNTKCYDGITQTIQALNQRGIKTGIVSNKPDARVKELAELYFKGYIDSSTAVGDRKGFNIKPSPDTVLEVIRILKVNKDNVLYVGDSDVDILTAQNAGLRCISVTWGFRDRDFLIAHKATTLIDKPQQLLEIVQNYR